MVSLPDGTTEKVSVIVTHWGQNEFRSAVMWRSIESLINTASGAEIIVVDNGGNYEDSLFLLQYANEGKIACYIRNRKNMHFGYARNQGVKLSSGNYIVIADNDISYENGWLETCLRILKEHPDKKLLATPLRTDRQHRNEYHWAGKIHALGKEWLVNMRAGSNCFLVKREHFNDIGWFEQHEIAGSRWNNKFQDKGYRMVTMETDSLAEDIGFKKGYNFREKIPYYEL